MNSRDFDPDANHTKDYLSIIERCADMQAAAIRTMALVDNKRRTNRSGWEWFYNLHVLPFIGMFEG